MIFFTCGHSLKFRFFKLSCFLFSDIGENTGYDNSVSGPPSGICSRDYACTVDEDDEIEFIFNIFNVKHLKLKHLFQSMT